MKIRFLKRFLNAWIYKNFNAKLRAVVYANAHGLRATSGHFGL